MKMWYIGAKSINSKTMFFVFRDVEGKRELATGYSVEINNLKNAYRRIQAEVDMGNKTIDSTLKYLEFLRGGHKDGEKCREVGKYEIWFNKIFRFLTQQRWV